MKQAQTLYGDLIFVMNVHLVIHLAKTVENFGPLNCYWVFCFESLMGHIQRKSHTKTDQAISYQK